MPIPNLRYVHDRVAPEIERLPSRSKASFPEERSRQVFYSAEASPSYANMQQKLPRIAAEAVR